MLAGIGIGMVIAGLLNFGINSTSKKSMTKAQIEEAARGIGMDYPSEFKVNYKGGTK